MDEVARTLASELALPDIATMTVILVRVLAAAMLGGIIGWERERKGRAAGLKISRPACRNRPLPPVTLLSEHPARLSQGSE